MPKTPSTAEVEQTAPSAAADSASAVVPNADEVVTRSPKQWAEVYFPNTPSGRLHEDAWKHSAAAVAHGWNHYVVRTGKLVQLTAAQYEAAIAAVSGNNSTPAPAADYRSKS